MCSLICFNKRSGVCFSFKRKTKRNKKNGHLIKEHSAQRVKGIGAVVEESGDDGGKSASDLLQLVRHLSHTNTSATASKEPDDVNMGANVSRHSVKGLSGRRSQSSGSICNGSGGSGSGKSSRHPDGKICGSLPNYLDERERNGACNNNRHEKSLDEVDRIPPLGDGAPLHWKFSDTQTALCDQGYGSERSPEEEYPPPLPDHDHLQYHHHLEPHAPYPFVTPDSTFLVKLMKGSRGLGLSVTGGIDSGASWPGIIRIKRLFPHQPASSCGLLNVGDLLLEANGITLTGLTNYEALEVLRTASNHVELRVCRPPPDVLNCVSPISEVPPPPPRREPPNSLNLSSAIYSTPEDEHYHGEFEITLTKKQGSLGFTLRKEDDSALGHYVRALVREPAVTDGRIRAGDKIIAVNDVEICPMSHEQAVQFLRQCPDVVKLRLYRDPAQTPVSTLSPSETTPRTSFSKKTNLRPEAVDMLNDIASRKLVNVSQEIYNRSMSPNSSPRRLRRQQCPSDASQADYDHYHEQFHEGLIQKCPHPFDEDAFNSLFSMESEDGDRPPRPVSLDLYNPNQTPVAARKPRFNFSLAHNAYELNNLDAEVLDAPNLTYNLGNEDVESTEPERQEAVSMPHIPITNPTFSYKHPAYQSAHPQIGSEPVEPGPSNKSTSKTDDGTLKKRRNTVQQEDVETKSSQIAHPMPMKEEYEVLAIELNRGWNSRLGFSLQGAAGVTYVSAVHADSVAAKDGRLKPGDRLIKVNDESIEHMTTSEIIDLLRIVRGPVCIVVSRVKSNEDCPKSNAEN
ncbi:tyrosine-protein phosphatase non-receptor type 13 isoform X2 [Leptinotarsa decemlineata]|uniref:tyrosine-protein phosphatase non-receptor type 13 isoform X2 n=1 Tax=Leptinotarsa decemlineata TaxID=7539 RepID=UPI003D308784